MNSQSTSPPESQDTSASSETSPKNIPMADAEFRINLPGVGYAAYGGYLGGSAANIWRDQEFWSIPYNIRRLPIWVGAVKGIARHDPHGDALTAVERCAHLNMLPRRVIALDMETSTDADYVREFGQVCHNHGYLVWVYGSKDFVVKLPPLDGYWIAWYTTETAWPDIPDAVAWQYGGDGKKDFSRIRHQRHYRHLW